MTSRNHTDALRYTVAPEAGGYWGVYDRGELEQGGFGSAAAAAQYAERREREANRDPCPTCGQRAVEFGGFIGAPGYGQAGTCEACGAHLWRAGACGQSGGWVDCREMDGPPELTEADVR